MLPSGIATLLCEYLGDHPALSFIRGQGDVKFSSPKNHDQPSGFSVDRSVKCTDNGAEPYIGDAQNPALGACGAVSTIPTIPNNKNRKKIDEYCKRLK